MSDPPLQRYWFRPKRIGYGFTPVTWEGWLTTLLFLLVILATLGQLVPGAPGSAAWAAELRDKHRDGLAVLLAHPAVILEVLAETAAFLIVGAWKTGPR